MVRRVNRMLRTLAPLTCALLGLALGGCSQRNSVFMPESAQNAPSTAPRAPPPAPLPAVAQRATTLIGLPVRSKSGKTLGAVQDIVFGANGTATHLILVRGRTAGPAGLLTAIPWKLAMKHIRGNALVLGAKRLTGAPGFTPGRWPDLGKSGWSAASDTYWAQSSPHAFKPIDPTSRSRIRPPMKL
jgi:sporulation protein YlmC with PRC-barrel domain